MGNLIKAGSCSICVPVGNGKDRYEADSDTDDDLDDSEYGSNNSDDSNPSSSNDDLDTIRQKIRKEKDKARKLKQKAKTEKKLRKKLERQWSADIQSTHSYHNDTDADMSVLSGIQSNKTPNHTNGSIKMGRNNSRDFIEIIDESPQFHWRESKYDDGSPIKRGNTPVVNIHQIHTDRSASISQNSRTVSEPNIEPQYILNVSESKKHEINQNMNMNLNMNSNIPINVSNQLPVGYHGNMVAFNPHLNTSMSFTNVKLLPVTQTQLYQQKSAPQYVINEANIQRVTPNMQKHKSQPLQQNGFFNQSNSTDFDEKDSLHVMSDYESELQHSVSNKSYKVNTNVSSLKIVTNMATVNENDTTNTGHSADVSTPIMTEDLKKKVLKLENDKSDMETELLAMKSIHELKKMGIETSGYRPSKQLSQRILGIDPNTQSHTNSDTDSSSESTSMSARELEQIQMHKQRASLLSIAKKKKNSVDKQSKLNKNVTTKNNHLAVDAGNNDDNDDDSDVPRHLMRLKSAEEWTADELESTEQALKANYIDIINGTCK